MWLKNEMSQPEVREEGDFEALVDNVARLRDKVRNSAYGDLRSKYQRLLNNALQRLAKAEADLE